MPIVAAQQAMNTLVRVMSQGSPQTANTIANVGDITGPGFSAAIVDVTSHSNSNPWRQKITTLLDAGDLAFKMFFVPSSAGSNDGVTPYGHSFTSGIGFLFSNRVLSEYQIKFPDPAATTWYANAYVSKMPLAATVAGVLEMPTTLTLTGEPILA